MSFTVAIDGPAAAGKGTISRAVARRFGLAHLDTGLIYRAVGARVAEGMEAVAAARGLTPADLERDDLRSAAAGQAASRSPQFPRCARRWWRSSATLHGAPAARCWTGATSAR
jgi:CMP/dCMP kinase